MIELPYSLVIEATEEPDFFGFYSDELEGFSGVGHSIEDCLFRAKWGMKEHVELLQQQAMPVPPVNEDPTVIIRNADAWDRQIEQDAKAGRLDPLAEQALRDLAEGRTTEI